MAKFDSLIEQAEALGMTENPADLDIAYDLFDKTLGLFHFTYFNPGEPEVECLFCGRGCALPGAYGETVYTSEEMEAEVELRDGVYWARVWATRALDILDPHYHEEPCCEERDKLLITFDL